VALYRAGRDNSQLSKPCLAPCFTSVTLPPLSVLAILSGDVGAKLDFQKSRWPQLSWLNCNRVEGKAMKTDIEYSSALQVLNPKHWGYAENKWYVSCTNADELKEWNPLHDDGDSRRLEIACLNALYLRSEETWSAWEKLESLRDSGKVDSGEYRAAVFALAVAIGKTMEGNDNAG